MPTISQRIALEGGDEIRRQLQAMGKAGSASFEQIEAAGIKAAQSLDRVVGAVRRAEVAFAALGTQAQAFGARFSNVASSFGSFESALLRTVRNITILAGAFTAAGAAAIKFGVGAAQAGDDLAESAQAIGASVADYQKLRAVFADAGIAEEQFAQVMGKFATETAEAAKLQQKAIEDSVIKSRDALQARGFRFPLDELRKSAEGTGRLAEDAAARLEAAGIRSAASLDKLREAAKLLGPEGDRARERLQRLGITFVGMGDAASRIIGPLSEASNILVKYGIAARDAAGNEIPLIDRLRALAVALDKLPDGFQKTADARAAFGRGGLRAVAALADFDRQVKATNALLEQYGIVVTDAEVATSSKFATSLVVLGEALTRIRTKIGAAFAPLLQLGTEAITNALVRQFGSVENAIEKMANTVRPIIVDIVLLLNGQDINPQGLVAKIQRQVTALITILSGAFKLIIGGANAVAKALNKIFGTEFTGPALLAAAAVLKFLGVFALVGGAIKFVTRSVGLLVSGLLLVGRTFGAVAAAAGALRFLPVLLAGLVGLPALVAGGLAALVLSFLTTRERIAQIWAALKPKLEKSTGDAIEGILKWLGLLPETKTIKVIVTPPTTSDIIESIRKDIKAGIANIKAEDIFSFKFDQEKFNQTMAAIKAAFVTLVTTPIANAFQWVLDVFDIIIEKIKAKLANIFTKTPEQGGQLGGQGVPLLGEGRDFLPESPFSENIEDRRGDLDSGLEAMRSAAQAVFKQIQQMGEAAFAAISAAAQQSAQLITEALNLAAAQEAFAGLEASAAASMQNITAAIQQATQALLELVNAANQAAQATSTVSTGAGSGGNGFAGGGQVFGRAGRDKVPAYLTRDEWVMRTAAVKKYGVSFMRAVNEGRFKLPKFNLGGLVDGLALSLPPLPMPQLADGGLVGAPSGRAINLTINNGASKDTFRMWADEEVAKKVVRYAVSRQVASAGRKSGAFG